MSEAWPWIAVALLGAYHGLNPAMGWLFAVSLGLQEHKRSRVIAALPPIAAGHLCSVALVVAVVVGAGVLVPMRELRLIGALAVAGFGLFRLLKPRLHPRWVAMRVNSFQLGLWSFLMATAHGAGLMLFPLLVALPVCSGLRYVTQVQSAQPAIEDVVGIVAIHTVAMLLVMGAIAVIVYDRVGLAILRRAWINLDLLWGLALILAGGAVLVL